MFFAIRHEKVFCSLFISFRICATTKSAHSLHYVKFATFFAMMIKYDGILEHETRFLKGNRSALHIHRELIFKQFHIGIINLYKSIDVYGTYT